MIVLLQRELVCSLGHLLDLGNRWPLYPAFVQFQVVCHIGPFLDQESLLTVTHPSITSQMDYCHAPYWGSHWRKLCVIQNVAIWTVMCIPSSACATCLLCELLVCFWIQLKVVTIPNKALHEARLFEESSLPLHPNKSGTWGMLWVRSIRECNLAGSSIIEPSLWNIISPHSH